MSIEFCFQSRGPNFIPLFQSLYTTLSKSDYIRALIRQNRKRKISSLDAYFLVNTCGWPSARMKSSLNKHTLWLWKGFGLFILGSEHFSIHSLRQPGTSKGKNKKLARQLQLPVFKYLLAEIKNRQLWRLVACKDGFTFQPSRLGWLLTNLP